MTGTPAPAVPTPLRRAATAAIAAGIVGGIVGLVLGLRAHPATAWFAIFEVGIPASALGGIVGLVAGAIRATIARRRPAP